MSTIEYIDKLYEKKPSEDRYHIGCSEIGHKCDRWLWLSFRHAYTPRFDGRMLRLFQLGHTWEQFFINDLILSGAEFKQTSSHGKQFSVGFDYHISGSLDGIILSGLKEMPDQEMVAEFKTHSSKSFDYLERVGLRRARPQHYTQVQLYMHGTGLKYAYYLAECKNDCRRWSDVISYNKKFAEKALGRAIDITMSGSLPSMKFTDPSCFDCKYCLANKMCYNYHNIINKNCRTCNHSAPLEDSTWVCKKFDSEIPQDYQLKSHACFEIHPDLRSARLELIECN